MNRPFRVPSWIAQSQRFHDLVATICEAAGCLQLHAMVQARMYKQIARSAAALCSQEALRRAQTENSPSPGATLVALSAIARIALEQNRSLLNVILPRCRFAQLYLDKIPVPGQILPRIQIRDPTKFNQAFSAATVKMLDGEKGELTRRGKTTPHWF